MEISAVPLDSPEKPAGARSAQKKSELSEAGSVRSFSLNREKVQIVAAENADGRNALRIKEFRSLWNYSHSLQGLAY